MDMSKREHLAKNQFAQMVKRRFAGFKVTSASPEVAGQVKQKLDESLDAEQLWELWGRGSGVYRLAQLHRKDPSKLVEEAEMLMTLWAVEQLTDVEFDNVQSIPCELKSS